MYLRKLMNDLDTDELQLKLESLTLEHRDLDLLIDHMHESAVYDQLQMRRLKKRKLQLKDMITKLESLLIPDLNA